MDKTIRIVLCVGALIYVVNFLIDHIQEQEERAVQRERTILQKFCTGEISIDRETGEEWCEFSITKYLNR